ncbi:MULTISPECIES: FKBP-type peptidyl-prolyl cis-trans isomerase [Streptomyces]|uniref:FKBP-type peptidyl-prolyl cis-trans isomerase n=1 Tax=Streptomyces TaxID=1883 RepID=UPI000FFE6A35|nr:MULTISPECIES: FKBP-type peptidyl-prolyl cis-trans isomerase [Streptomyces]NDK27319.1 FKBP-type peptidyl-prolyl cis-trans isomerase [Streptomyces sp. TR1341]UWW93856.1 FKBP-type peptidyl-prolyl cis-trans isomerase [Streptomyces murinus]WSI84544.1 FKBP-type peptidyl-prolyl cis-trans isomerase [Streptomyces murinus]WUD06265.1 FKBP-type peptidyl-prolyl cis-trans isomerase [Streptomyces murinus]
MRRRSLLLATVPAGLVTLAGCGGKSGSSQAGASPSPSAPSAPPPKIVDGPLPAITAGTRFGEKPTVAKGTGAPSKNLAVRTAIPGTGRTVAENDFVQANYLGQIWDTGKVFDNSYDRHAPLVMQLAQGSLIDGWRYGLVGKKTGSRVEIAVPPTWGYGKAGNPQAGIKGTDTLVFVVDVIDSFNSKSSARGRAVPQNDPALPKVATVTNGTVPVVKVPHTDAPDKLVSTYVLEGDGPELKADQTVLCQFQGLVWEGGKTFQRTYGSGRLSQFSLSQMQETVKGLAQGLVGKKVGSRVLVVVPPQLGYGDNPPSGSPVGKGATLVFTVDILAAM